VNPTSLAGIARIEEPSENYAREDQDGAAHSDVPRSGLASATGARLVRLYLCSFWAANTLRGRGGAHRDVPGPPAVYDLLKRAER
jgi:hypothetical protein